ncbi:MAG: glycoside hydrolase family 97 N-terminal domain-containing protein, partial [Bacteroidaceae bacterium]|nr:glycoside hydrolase family 97 N-terminal domain-containing protein [Bacteroidaceae bacterium]
MKKIIRKCRLWISFCIVLFLASCASVKRWECSSPNGNLTVKVFRQKSGEMSYILQAQEKLLLTNSSLGFQLSDGRCIPNEEWV